MKFYTLLSILGLSIFSLSVYFGDFVTARKMEIPIGTGSILEYPSGDEFLRLRSLIDETFTPKMNSQSRYSSYGSKCIDGGRLCPNYRYTSITEKAIKYIILDTYTGNEIFYNKLFPSSSYEYSIDGYTSPNSTPRSLKQVLTSIPIGTPVLSSGIDLFSSSRSSFSFVSRDISKDLIQASFGVDFTENANASSLLTALEQKIKDMKRTKCQMNNSTEMSVNRCPWGNGDISNRYLPTREELYQESIFLNRGTVKIGDIKDEFEYTMNGNQDSIASILKNSYTKSGRLDTLIESILKRINDSGENTFTWTGSPGAYSFSGTRSPLYSRIASIKQNIELLRNNPRYSIYEMIESVINSTIFQNSNISKEESEIIQQVREEMEYYKNAIDTEEQKLSYRITYAKESYTLEEAKEALEKRSDLISSVVFGSNSWGGTLPCQSSPNFQVRSECAKALANMNTIQTALGAYYSDRETYPSSIEALNQNYLPKGRGDFSENFEYRFLTGASPSYEIRYIGKIGEGVSLTSGKKDYNLLLSGVTLPPIPEIFARAPYDSVVLYIRDPENLFALLNTQSNTSTRLSGVDASETIKKMIQDFFELKSMEELEKNLKHETLLVLENLDFTTPDVTLILSEADREALAPSAQARVVGSKDGYIYVSSSKTTIDRLMNLSREKSLIESPDFRYVWVKKSQMIRDAYMFVGDAFFEKMITFETYLAHYRKYRDVRRLSKLQELVWAYQDATGSLPKDLETTVESLDPDKSLIDILEYYTLSEDGIITDKKIGSLKNLRSLSEIDPELSTITRTEVEDYKANVLKYRDVWAAALDPMGIVMNRYGDGIEVDFFMTPIPEIVGELGVLKDFFENSTKENLSFLSNNRLRIGLLSFVLGFDPKKIRERITTDDSLKRAFSEFEEEVLGGKSMFNYIGGEGVFTLGNIPADILDGWNVEKIDAHIAIEFLNEEKGKEFIEIVRKKLLEEFSDSPSGGYLDVKNFLAKPLIEDYEGKQIFYIEAIPVPFVGKIGFAYTFVDNFFFIALNRTSIKRVIDVANTGDSAKQDLIDDAAAPKHSFFVTLFDGNSASDDLRGLYEKNRTSLSRYASLLENDTFSSEDSLTPIVSTYYVTQERLKRLGMELKPYSYTFGGLSLLETESNLSVYLDKEAHATLSGTTLQIWNNLLTDDRFPKDILSSPGIRVEDFLAHPMKYDILALELIVQLDRAFLGTESLLRNTTFALHIGDNEIGFISRVFRQKDRGDELSSVLRTDSWKNYALGGFLLLILISLGIGVVLYQRRHSSPLTPQIQSFGGESREMPMQRDDLNTPSQGVQNEGGALQDSSSTVPPKPTNTI